MLQKYEAVFEFLKQQGFTICLCCVGLWWFNKQYDRQQTQINQLNDYIKIEFKNTIEKNTEAYNKFSSETKQK